jgi:hypothetical protein
MVAQLLLEETTLATGEQEEADGLLVYLQTLCRVAHAPGESHWCTPGHNRGRALERAAPDLLATGSGQLALVSPAGSASAPRVVALRGLSRSWWDVPHLAFGRAEA